MRSEHFSRASGMLIMPCKLLQDLLNDVTNPSWLIYCRIYLRRALEIVSSAECHPGVVCRTLFALAACATTAGDGIAAGEYLEQGKHKQSVIDDIDTSGWVSDPSLYERFVDIAFRWGFQSAQYLSLPIHPWQRGSRRPRVLRSIATCNSAASLQYVMKDTFLFMWWYQCAVDVGAVQDSCPWSTPNIIPAILASHTPWFVVWSCNLKLWTAWKGGSRQTGIGFKRHAFQICISIYSIDEDISRCHLALFVSATMSRRCEFFTGAEASSVCALSSGEVNTNASTPHNFSHGMHAIVETSGRNVHTVCFWESRDHPAFSHFTRIWPIMAKQHPRAKLLLPAS